MQNESRETFASRFGLLMTMIGVAVGLGNVWRFPYMVGKFGGAPFVIFYIAMVLLIGIPALVAEWTLGRYTRRGPVGAFAQAGVSFGKQFGWFFFMVVAAATAYYTNALGWVLFYAIGETAYMLGIPWNSAEILPPNSGFVTKSFFLQLTFSGLVILTCAMILLKGLRAGIERISKVIMPALLVILFILIIRSLTLPGAWQGVEWYILKFEPSALTGNVMLAALGQAIFTLSLGGTYMVVYGSYLNRSDNLVRNAVWTGLGDTTAGLLAGLAIIPAVIAFGLEPGSGPGLLFFTLPKVFAEIPFGGFFGLLFFIGLFGAAYLSDVAAFEVLVAGIIDNTGFTRKRAVWLIAALVFVLAIPSMINMEIFVPWDLTFGSGMQTLGSLLAVIAVAWAIKRSDILKEIIPGGNSRYVTWLYFWLRFVIPAVILLIGIWWLVTEVIQVAMFKVP
ncbi:MAG: sodium-dependent transporter [bacterium]